MKIDTKSWLTTGALVALLALPSAADAQVRIGARAGANFANLSGDDVVDGEFDSSTGLYLQGVVAFPLGDFFAIESGLAYSRKGASHDAADEEIDLTYLEVPLLFRANFTAEGLQPHLLVGPSVAFRIGCSFTDGGVEFDCDDDDDMEIKGTDFGLLVGGGIDLPMGGLSLTLDGFYNLGLSAIDDSIEENDVHNEIWTIAAGFTVPLGG